MGCSNCYNGCPEIVSDKCVKYTGVDVPVLGIQTGDSLSYVEQALIEFLTSTLDGTGIKIDLDPAVLCEFVSEKLPTCGDITLVDILNALTESVCFLKDLITALEAKFSELEQGYIIDCLEGSPDPTSTYEVLQATINKLCALETDLTALALDVDTNYVKLADLNTLILAYLDTQGTSTKYYNRMVPYTVVEYYGPLSNFDISGAGIGDWEQIYLCNGNNGTPDKRGRSPIGAIQGMGGGALSPVVDPGSGNFNYALNDVNGVNSVVLSPSQMPTHTHIATVSITDPGHFHYEYNIDSPGPGTDVSATSFPCYRGDLDDNLSYRTVGTSTIPTLGKTSTSVTGLNGSNVTVANANAGSSAAHNNVHPVLACYYIMYIPNP